MQTKKSKISIKGTIYLMAALLMAISGPDASAQNVAAREHLQARKLASKTTLNKRISFLCDTLCEGRGCGQRGGGVAALWLQREFERIGLMKLGEGYGHAAPLGNGKYGRNIVGMLPGSKETSRNRYVIVGAHYDHIGTLDGKIYPGADANASGTAALLSIAEMLSEYKSNGKSHDHNVIFVAFDAKENNMAGSKALWDMIRDGQLKDPQTGASITKEKISLMVNIDQIGCTISPLESGRKDYLIMLGNHTLRPYSQEIISRCNREYAIDMEIDHTYYGSKNFTKMFYRLSDQRIFIDNGIPSVLFTSGITMNTNKTRDTAQTIDLEILRKRIFLMYHWLEKMI